MLLTRDTPWSPFTSEPPPVFDVGTVIDPNFELTVAVVGCSRNTEHVAWHADHMRTCCCLSCDGRNWKPCRWFTVAVLRLELDVEIFRCMVLAHSRSGFGYMWLESQNNTGLQEPAGVLARP